MRLDLHEQIIECLIINNWHAAADENPTFFVSFIFPFSFFFLLFFSSKEALVMLASMPFPQLHKLIYARHLMHFPNVCQHVSNSGGSLPLICKTRSKKITEMPIGLNGKPLISLKVNTRWVCIPVSYPFIAYSIRHVNGIMADFTA